MQSANNPVCLFYIKSLPASAVTVLMFGMSLYLTAVVFYRPFFHGLVLDQKQFLCISLFHMMYFVLYECVAIGTNV